MEGVLLVSLIALWAVVLVNLLLTLRAIRWLRDREVQLERNVERETLPELEVGTPAPNFRSKTLSGRSVRLADYVGRSVVFLFVSPHCGHCRKEVPALAKLGPLAQDRANVEFVLVSDSSTAETYSWIETIQQEDRVEVSLPILVAPLSTSDFVLTFNPRGLSPYFCLVDEQGVVRARGPIGTGKWPELKREWEGSDAVKLPSRSLSQYR